MPQIPGCLQTPGSSKQGTSTRNFLIDALIGEWNELDKTDDLIIFRLKQAVSTPRGSGSWGQFGAEMSTDSREALLHSEDVRTHCCLRAACQRDTECSTFGFPRCPVTKKDHQLGKCAKSAMSLSGWASRGRTITSLAIADDLQISLVSFNTLPHCFLTLHSIIRWQSVRLLQNPFHGLALD